MLYRLFGGAASAAPRPARTPAPAMRPVATPRPTPTPIPPVVKPSPTPRPTPKPSLAPAPRPSALPSAAPTPRPTPTPVPAGLQPSPKPTAKPAVTPAPRADLAKVGPILYEESIRFLTIGVSKRVEPRFTLLSDPPALQLELPNAALPKPFKQAYPASLIERLEAEQLTPTSVRLTLHFARPVGKAWTLKQTNGRLILVFDRRPLDAAPAPTPTPVPPVATPAPSAAPPTPTPQPSASVPTPAPATPVPTPTPVPAAPTPQPSAAAPTPAPAPAGHPFSGTVTSLNDTAPVEGASIVAGNYRTMTDASGRFAFKGLPAGKLVVTITARGFAPQTFEILIPEDRELAINLVPSL